MARRDHPLGLPVRDRRRPSRRRPGRRRPGRRPHDRHARPDRHGRLPGPRAAPGWTVEATLEGTDASHVAAAALGRPAGACAGWTREIQRSCSRHARRVCLPPEDDARLGSASIAGMAPAARRPRHLACRGPGRPAAGPPSSRPLPAARPLRVPDGEVAEAVTIQVGFRRVEIRGLDLLINGAARLHPRRQPPRLRPAHRARHDPRLDARRPRRS